MRLHSILLCHDVDEGLVSIIFLARVLAANLSLQYVNSIYCIMSYGLGIYGPGGGEVVRVAYNIKYVRLKHVIIMAPLGTTCA